jgi:hypothetical protein
MGNSTKGGEGATRARNILQHGLGWISGPDMEKSLIDITDGNEKEREIVSRMWRNLVRMREETREEQLGYSHG